MKCRPLCVVIVGLSGVVLAQSPSPLLLQHIPSRDTQSIVFTSFTHCDSSNNCTTTGVDQTLAGGGASGGNRYDSQGKLFIFRPLFPTPQEIWLMKPNGNLTKFADSGISSQACVADSNGATVTTGGIGDFSFNLVDNSFRVSTSKNLQTSINTNGWMWGCDASGVTVIPISSGSGSPTINNDSIVALVKITGPVL